MTSQWYDEVHEADADTASSHFSNSIIPFPRQAMSGLDKYNTSLSDQHHIIIVENISSIRGLRIRIYSGGIFKNWKRRHNLEI